jgi:hypothetical protein
MLADMISRLGEVGITARAAIADTRGAAHALARFAARPSLLVPEGHSTERIRPLPISALRLAPDTVDDLRKLGFERIMDVLRMPRAPLTLRFGPELGRRIDQAIGVRPRIGHLRFRYSPEGILWLPSDKQRVMGTIRRYAPIVGQIPYPAFRDHPGSGVFKLINEYAPTS